MTDKVGTTHNLLDGPFGIQDIFWLPMFSNPTHADAGIKYLLNTIVRAVMRINRSGDSPIAII
jgi:hypothetical protein